MSERWIRSQRAAVAELGDDLLLIGRDGSVRRLDGDSAELAREVLALFARAHDEAEVVAHVETLAGPLGDRKAVVHDLVTLLRDTGAIEPARAAVARSGVNVVVAISGAIAASHAPLLVSALQRRGHTVEIALTQTAMRFVSIETLAALTQREPHTSLWPRAAHVPVPHVALARWADVVIVYPASGTTIARIANGDFSDLVSAIALTTRGAVALAPSMNIDMLEAPAVQRNLAKLRDDGFTILHGVPSQEVADAPAARTSVGGSAPAAVEVAATLDALRKAGVLRRRDDRERTSPAAWDAAYRQQLVPWAVDTCDADIALALAEHAAPHGGIGAAAGAAATSGPRRLLDVGCGLGQIARHAIDAGYRVVATDLADTALATARAAAGARDITWLRDDICATALLGPFDVIVDRATLHTLPPVRAQAWAAAMRKLTAPGASVIVKAHRDGVAGVTIGYSTADIAALLPDFAVISERDGELPGVTDDKPIAATLVVLRRR